MTPIQVAAADPVALATQAAVQAGRGNRNVQAAAAGLLAAGISLRRPCDGEVLLEFASGSTCTTTIRWVQTPYGSTVSVDNPGQPYCPPDIPLSVLGNVKLGRQPAATVESVKTLMRALNESGAWQLTGFRSLGLRPQIRLANVFWHLQRQMARWVETWDADKPELGRQAHRKIQTLGMVGQDCRTRITAERDATGNIVSMTVETGPEPHTKLKGKLGSTIVAPATESGITATWSTGSSEPDGQVKFSNGWKTLTEYWNLMAAQKPENATKTPAWPELMQQLGTHPCWKALKLPEAVWYDDHSWKPWPDEVE